MQWELGYWVLGGWDKTKCLEDVWQKSFLVVSLANMKALPFKDTLG